MAAAGPILTQENYTSLVNRLTLLLKRAESNPRIAGRLWDRAKVDIILHVVFGLNLSFSFRLQSWAFGDCNWRAHDQAGTLLARVGHCPLILLDREGYIWLSIEHRSRRYPRVKSLPPVTADFFGTHVIVHHLLKYETHVEDWTNHLLLPPLVRQLTKIIDGYHDL